MKQFALLMGTILGLSLGAGAARAASTNALTVRFNLTAYTLKPEVTVTNATSTNSIVGLNTMRFGTPDLLKLLETEFHTNFAAGSQLGLDLGFKPVVMDKTGAVVLQAGSNPADSSYFLSISNNSSALFSGKTIETRKTQTQMLKLLEPDVALYYADGQGNQFHFGGLAFITAEGVSTTNGPTVYKNVSLLIPGCSGGGQLFNPQTHASEDAAFSGVFGASGSGLAD